MGWIFLGAFGHMLGSGALLLDKELLKKISPRVFFVISEIPWFSILLFLPFVEIWNARVASLVESQTFFRYLFFRYPVSMQELVIMARPGVCVAVAVLFLYNATSRDIPSRVAMATGIAKPVAAAAASVFWLGRIFSGWEIFAFLLFLAAAWSAGISFFRGGATDTEDEGTHFSFACACIAGAGFGLHGLWWQQSVRASSFVSAFYWQSVGQICVGVLVLSVSVRPVVAWLSNQLREARRRHKHQDAGSEQPLKRFLRLFAANKVFGIVSVSMVSCALAYGDVVFVSSLDGAKYLTAFFNEYRVGVRRAIGMRWAFVAALLLGAGIMILAFLMKPGAG